MYNVDIYIHLTLALCPVYLDICPGPDVERLVGHWLLVTDDEASWPLVTIPQ